MLESDGVRTRRKATGALTAPISTRAGPKRISSLDPTTSLAGNGVHGAGVSWFPALPGMYPGVYPSVYPSSAPWPACGVEVPGWAHHPNAHNGADLRQSSSPRLLSASAMPADCARQHAPSQTPRPCMSDPLMAPLHAHCEGDGGGPSGPPSWPSMLPAAGPSAGPFLEDAYLPAPAFVAAQQPAWMPPAHPFQAAHAALQPMQPAAPHSLGVPYAPWQWATPNEASQQPGCLGAAHHHAPVQPSIPEACPS